MSVLFEIAIINGEKVRLDYRGDWDANTNTPTLTSGTGDFGAHYRVGTAGTTALDGESSWAEGDSLYFDGTAWVKVPAPGTGSGGGGGGGISPLRIVRLATTANIANLATGAPNTVDGQALAVGDRILVGPNQTNGSQRGIYRVDVVGTGSDGEWSRAADFNNAVEDEIQAGLQVYVQEGTTFAQAKYFLVTTGAITIGATALEFILEGGLARTDASSTEVIASTAFQNGTFEVSSNIDMRDHSHLAVFFNPTNLGTNTEVDIVLFWSDDGTTIPFATDDNLQTTDFDIVNQSDGSFSPLPYTARLTTVGGELVANKRQHLIFPKAGGVCRVGVKGNAANGAYSVRTQRITR